MDNKNKVIILLLAIFLIMLIGCVPNQFTDKNIFDESASIENVIIDEQNMMKKNDSREIVFVVRQFLSDAPALIADELGYYSDEDLQVKTILVEKGKYAAPLLLSGEADLAILGNKWTILVQIEDVKNEIEIIADLGGGGKRWRVMARKDSNISSIQDLNNKKLGSWVTSYGYAKFELFLKDQNINIIPVKLQGMSTYASSYVLNKSLVDAVFVWEPHPSVIEENELGEEVFTFEGMGNEMSVYLHARTDDFLESDPRSVFLILKALKRAQEFIEENPDEAAKIISSKRNLSISVIKKTFQYIDYDIRFDENEEEDVNMVIRTFRKTGINDLPEEININLNGVYVENFERSYIQKSND